MHRRAHIHTLTLTCTQATLKGIHHRACSARYPTLAASLHYWSLAHLGQAFAYAQSGYAFCYTHSLQLDAHSCKHWEVDDDEGRIFIRIVSSFIERCAEAAQKGFGVFCEFETEPTRFWVLLIDYWLVQVQCALQPKLRQLA